MRKAKLLNIVMGRSWTSARKLNVKLLEKFDQDGPSPTEAAGVEEDPAGPEESSDETTITPTITTLGSTSSYDLDNDDTEKNEVELELDTNDPSEDHVESSKKDVASAAAPLSSKEAVADTNATLPTTNP